MILNRSFLFIIGLFFLSCTGSKLPSNKENGRPSGVDEERRSSGVVGLQWVYMVRNKSDKQVRWQYPSGKKEIIAPGGCVHYRAFSLNYGIYIYAGGKKICGSNQGKNICKVMSSSGDTSGDVCGKGGEGYLCPAEGSFDITGDLVLQENGKTVSAEDFASSTASSCPMLRESEESLAPIREG